MKFEKVSRETFKRDCKKFEHMIGPYNDEWYDNIIIPTRSTSGSAGYDFYSPVTFTFKPEYDNMVYFPSGIKIELDEDKYLQLVVRSSVGKKGIMIANTLGIIDFDYYNNPDNEGDIIIGLYKYRKETVPTYSYINAGDKVVQGIILPFYKVDGDDITDSRTGGFGSTGK